jgi:hypothetical protein
VKDPRVASNYNTPSEIVECVDHMTFDGVYLNVFDRRHLLNGKRFTLFPMGDYLGRSNRFDTGMPLERFCDKSQIRELLKMGGSLGWHTFSHQNLTELSLDEAREEMTAPQWAIDLGCDEFAYPYGEYNEDLKKLAEDLGYKRAWSVTQGDGSQFARKRRYL